MVQHVNSKEFESIVSTEEKPVFCDFWATWCSPCRMLAPVYKKVAEKYEGKAVFLKIDVDENEDVARQYSVSSIPNILVFKNATPTDSHLGFAPESVLEAFVQKNL